MTMASPSKRASHDDLPSHSSPQPRNEHPYSRPRSASRYSVSSRRGSIASSIFSIGGTLDTSSQSHGVSESAHNAISTLLQPPIVRTGLLPHTSAPASSAHKPPTSRDIPPVTLTNIPTINPAEFEPYISQVGALYDALQKARENEEDGGTQLLRKSPRPDDSAGFFEADARSSRSSLSRQGSLASLTEPSSTRKRSSSASGRRTVQAPTPLSTVPNVYFDENFHLENPRTFDIVSERSDVVRPAAGAQEGRRGSNGNPASPRKALATNAILQEKLSWYMDTIEVHLISSISTASTSFFAALGSLKDLHSEAAESVSRIKALRRELKSLDKEMAVGGLDIVNQRRRRENLKRLSDAVQQLKLIAEKVGKCESLVGSGEVEKALDAIDDLERLIAGEESEAGANGIALRDLRGAAALQDVGSDLEGMRFRIGKAFEGKFLNVLIGDLRHHVETVSSQDILLRWSNSSQRTRGHNREPSVFPSYLAVGEEFRSLLLSNIGGLYRARHTSPAATAFRDSILREVRNIIRRPLPSSNDDDADSMMSASTVGGGRHMSQHEKSSILARNLRALDPEDAEELLKKIYIPVGETLRRVGTQAKVLLDVASTLGDPMSPTLSMGSPGIRSPNIQTPGIDGRMSGAPLKGVTGRGLQEELHQTLDMANLLGQVVDTAQDKIVKVLRVRSEQSTNLSVERFLRYFTLNLLFANECEAVSGRSGTPLKNVVNGHIKDFVQHLSDSERQKLASGMEADTWNAKDFADEDKELLTRILSASTEDAKAWTEGSKIWLPASAAPDTLPTTSNGSLSLPGGQTNGTSRTSTPTPSVSPSKTPEAPKVPAVIESEPFLLTISPVLCLRGLSSFLHLMTGLPSLANDVASSIISYLTLFNSRCTQLILGAGATRSAGLKNITAKQLALAAQALSFISTLIPHIREFVRRHAGSGVSVSNTMGEFDKVRRAYLEHQQSIYDKLVDMMAGRATLQAKAMRAIDWEKEGKGVNQYMETLTKETKTLHKVLSKHLPEGTVKMIMLLVFESYKEQWGKAFGDVVLVSEEGQQRMLRDAECLNSRIGGLDGAGDIGKYIVNIIKEKSIPKAPEPTASGKTSSESESKGSTDSKEEGVKAEEKESAKAS